MPVVAACWIAPVEFWMAAVRTARACWSLTLALTNASATLPRTPITATATEDAIPVRSTVGATTAVWANATGGGRAAEARRMRRITGYSPPLEYTQPRKPRADLATGSHHRRRPRNRP